MNQMDNENFNQPYQNYKKRNNVRIIAIVAIVVAVLGAGGFGYWWMNRSDDAQNSEVAGAQSDFPGGRRFNGNFNPDDLPEDFEGRRPPGGNLPEGGPPGGGFGVDQFFSEDGSVDQAAVDQFLERVPQGGDSNFLSFFKQNIDRSVEDGSITQSQADALIDALGGNSEAI